MVVACTYTEVILVLPRAHEEIADDKIANHRQRLLDDVADSVIVSTKSIKNPYMMISLRHAARRGCRQLSRRSFATSRQKRALNEQQLGKAAATPPPPAPPDAATAGGGSSVLPIVAVLAAAGGAGAYYMDLIPGLSETPSAPAATKEKASPEPEKEAPEKEEPPVVQKETKEVEEEAKEESSLASAPVEPEPAKEDAPAGNRVLNITLPEGSSYSASPEPITEHPLGGNRVKMEPAKKSADTPPSVDDALHELQRQISKDDSTRSLIEAHKDLAMLSSMDLSELDEMSVTQLKIRLVQMAKDMEERTKWEAVRLKEFLAMKEKEVEDK